MSCIDFLYDQLRSIDCTVYDDIYICIADFLGVVEVAGVKIRVYCHLSKLKGLMRRRNGVTTHLLLIKLTLSF